MLTTKLAILATIPPIPTLGPDTLYGFYSAKQKNMDGGSVRYRAIAGTDIVECTEVHRDPNYLPSWDDVICLGPIGAFVSSTMPDHFQDFYPDSYKLSHSHSFSSLD